MALDADRIRSLFRLHVRRTLTGDGVVTAGLAGDLVRLKEYKADRDLVYVELEATYAGSFQHTFLYTQLSLEDSEGYLIDASPSADVIDFTLEKDEQGAGGVLFSLYRDLQPVRLWFDTGMEFDDSRAPLLIEIPYPRASTRRQPVTWKEQVALGIDKQTEASTRGVLPLFEIDELMGQISRKLSLPHKKLSNGYMFRVPLPGGRRQHVLMSFTGSDEEGSPLIRFITLCAPAGDDGANYELFLRTNPRLSYGAIGIAEVDGEDFYVLTDTQLIETADQEELIKSITYLAQRGDELESQLTGGQDLR